MKTGATTYYQVADHLFAVQTDDSALLALMTNYEPFKTQPAISTDVLPIFQLQASQNGLLEAAHIANYQLLFTDQSDEDMPRIEVFQTQYPTSIAQDGGWLLRVSQIAHSPICCEIECTRDFAKGLLHIAHDCQDLRFCIDNALMLLFAFRTAPLKTLEMHAAVVVKPQAQQELAYLFLGHSGTGKSTHARQWLKAFPDAWLLNDDNPILRVMEDGDIRVYGSPWSGKTPCYINANVQVGAIVKLSQAPVNQIAKLLLPQAYAYMLSSASGLKIETQMADHLYQTIKHIITHLQCYHLACLPNTQAAECCWLGICNN